MSTAVAESPKIMSASEESGSPIEKLKPKRSATRSELAVVLATLYNFTDLECVRRNITAEQKELSPEILWKEVRRRAADLVVGDVLNLNATQESLLAHYCSREALQGDPFTNLDLEVFKKLWPQLCQA